MGEHDRDQGDVTEPARPPLSVTAAREVTAGLRAAMDDVRRSIAVLAARVRHAHAARVWFAEGAGELLRAAPRSPRSVRWVCGAVCPAPSEVL
ncbi:hypothetical protein ACFC4G_47510 [Streptomyces sp. NPDC056002]|uniref:hypothetical protein n=1 Tax=Streptomyces sp. NPDC056002 TaxID=3345675 RepID=UPI0035D6AF1D